MFRQSDGNADNCIMSWDGSQWHSAGGGMGGGTTVQARTMEVHNNYLYVAGTYSSAGGMPANNIARWDGTNWCALGGTFDNVIGALAFYNDTLYIAGGFWVVNGNNIRMVSKWTGGNYVDSCGHINVGISEVNNNQEITISPNPSNGIFTIHSERTKVKQIKIMNILGEEILKQWTMDTSTSSVTIDMNGYAKGIYFVQITDENKNEINKKIVLE